MSKRGSMLYETGMPAKSYYNFLHSVQKSGVYVKTVRNWDFSLWWLYSLHGYIQSQHFHPPAAKYTEAEEVISALMGIPKIGEKKAQMIFNEYQKTQRKPSSNTNIPDDVKHSILSDDSKPYIETDEEFDALMREIEEELEEVRRMRVEYKEEKE